MFLGGEAYMPAISVILKLATNGTIGEGGESPDEAE
jgi:hypothetical protein